MNGLRSLENLLADELLLQQRAGARNQVRGMMQDTSGSIAEQNEQQLAAGAQQMIRPKLEARMMKERQDQARQRQALAGIAGQSAPNMARMADGGIVGYAQGGTSQSPRPTPDGKPTAAAQDATMADINNYIEQYKAYEASKANAATPEEKQQVEKRFREVQQSFDPETLAKAHQKMSGMKQGGIVGFQEGGMPRFPRLFDFSMFLAEKGIDSLAGLSTDAVNRLRQEYEAMQTREMNRPRGDSVSESQMENLGGALRGAGNVLAGGITNLVPEPRGKNATELADMGGAPGAGGAPQARREPSAADLADAQAEMDILNAAQRRRDEAEGGIAYPQYQGYKDRPSVDLSAAYSQAADETRAISEEEPTGILGQLGRLFRPSSAQRAGNRARDAERSRISGELQEFRDRMSRPLDELDYYDPNAPKQTDEEVAKEIIATAPSTEDADAAAMKGVPQIANESLRRAIEGQGAPTPTPAPTQEAEVETVTNVASTVAQNPTPENTSRFESEIERLMERRESPVRALSDFLAAFSQARGGSMGQNLAIATTAMRKADDALDNRIIELEKLRRADQISERDFGLRERQLQAQKGLLDAQAKYYANYKDMQVEIANIRAQQSEEAANRRLYQSILDITEALLPNYRMAAMSSLRSDDPSSQEVLTETNRLMQEAIRTQFREAQEYFKLSGDVNAGGPQITEGQTATNAQGEKIVFRNGNWEAM